MWLEKGPWQLGQNASALPVIYKSYEEEKWCVKNVRRMRSERVNLFFVSLFAWLRTFWRVPLRKFSRFRPLKISRERYQPIIMTGKSLPDVLSMALRPVEFAAATAQCGKIANTVCSPEHPTHNELKRGKIPFWQDNTIQCTVFLQRLKSTFFEVFSYLLRPLPLKFFSRKQSGLSKLHIFLDFNTLWIGTPRWHMLPLQSHIF